MRREERSVWVGMRRVKGERFKGEREGRENAVKGSEG